MQADERVNRAECERKEMADRLAQLEQERSLLSSQLAKVLEDRASAKEGLNEEHERSSQLSGELVVLQKQRQTTERLWAEEVSCLRGQLLVQQQEGINV